VNVYKENPFVFDSKYRLLRHLIFWLVHILIFTFLYRNSEIDFWNQNLLSALWVPAFILYGYPIMFWVIPMFLLKEKYLLFSVVLFLWAVGGYFLNYLFRAYIYFPLANLWGLAIGNPNPWAVNSYLSMNVMAGFGSMIVLFKYWIKKQHDFLLEQNEKINSELQLLKAQVHPHFLFNTLNNIYSFSIESSPKAPRMILQLSSLLSYVLYDCKANEVLLENEIRIMKDYIELEKERYANRLEVSLNIEGDIKNKYISPLLLLPFVENAFKHGTSGQLEKPWLSMDIAVKQQILRCKIVNSKNEISASGQVGIGIQNVQKRLAYLYESRHELKINDEGNFFVVSLMLELKELQHEETKFDSASASTKKYAV
jgi:hypothetical protein